MKEFIENITITHYKNLILNQCSFEWFIKSLKAKKK